MVSVGMVGIFDFFIVVSGVHHPLVVVYLGLCGVSILHSCIATPWHVSEVSSIF